MKKEYDHRGIKINRIVFFFLVIIDGFLICIDVATHNDSIAKEQRMSHEELSRIENDCAMAIRLDDEIRNILKKAENEELKKIDDTLTLIIHH